jgi:hypothetical protein
MKLLKRAHKILIELAYASEKCPSSLFLKKIEVSFDAGPFDSGGFAAIYAATYDGQAVALKFLHRFSHSQCKEQIQRVRRTLTQFIIDVLIWSPQRFWREALLWRQLKHSHILPLLGIDDSRPQLYSICMVSPLMGQGNVLGHMERLGPENVNVLGLVRYILLSAGNNSPFCY